MHILTVPTFPSQAYIINSGLNTWPERQWEWDSGIEWDRSLNHLMQAGFSAWFYESFQWKINIPANSSATVFIPAGEIDISDISGNKIISGQEVTYLRNEDDYLVYKFESGAYVIYSLLNDLEASNTLNSTQQKQLGESADINKKAALNAWLASRFLNLHNAYQRL